VAPPTLSLTVVEPLVPFVTPMIVMLQTLYTGATPIAGLAFAGQLVWFELVLLKLLM
jgi:hypothetical protein